MSFCCCTLAGTSACHNCPNNHSHWNPIPQNWYSGWVCPKCGRVLSPIQKECLCDIERKLKEERNAFYEEWEKGLTE